MAAAREPAGAAACAATGGTTVGAVDEDAARAAGETVLGAADGAPGGGDLAVADDAALAAADGVAPATTAGTSSGESGSATDGAGCVVTGGRGCETTVGVTCVVTGGASGVETDVAGPRDSASCRGCGCTDSSCQSRDGNSQPATNTTANRTAGSARTRQSPRRRLCIAWLTAWCRHHPAGKNLLAGIEQHHACERLETALTDFLPGSGRRQQHA